MGQAEVKGLAKRARDAMGWPGEVMGWPTDLKGLAYCERLESAHNQLK